MRKINYFETKTCSPDLLFVLKYCMFKNYGRTLVAGKGNAKMYQVKLLLVRQEENGINEQLGN